MISRYILPMAWITALLALVMTSMARAETIVPAPPDGEVRIVHAKDPVFVVLSVPTMEGALPGDVPSEDGMDDAALALEAIAEHIASTARTHEGRLIALVIDRAWLSTDDPAACTTRLQLCIRIIDEARTRGAADAPLAIADLPLPGLGHDRNQVDAWRALMARLDALLTQRSFVFSDPVVVSQMLARPVSDPSAIATGKPVFFLGNRRWCAWLPVSLPAPSVKPARWQTAVLLESAEDGLDEHPVASAQSSESPESAGPGEIARQFSGSSFPTDTSNFPSVGGGGGGSGGGGGGGSGGGGSGGGGSGGGGSGGGGSGGGGFISSGSTDGGEGEVEGEEEGDPDPPAAEEERLLLLTNLDDPESVQLRYSEWNTVTAEMIYQWAFDANEDGRSTPDERWPLDWWLENRIPADYDGYLCVDWEYGVIQILRAGPGHPRFAEVVEEMRDLLVYIKSQRPLAKAGYWGMPVREYWNQDEAWREAMLACAPIFEISDVLYPSIYDHYNDNADRDHARFAVVVSFALELAPADAEVMLYTWHRYHRSGGDHGYQLVAEQEYIDHIAHALNAEYGGRLPHGIVAWGAETWYYESAFETDEAGNYVNAGVQWNRVRTAYTHEMDEGETIEQYKARLFPQVYDHLAQAITAAMDARQPD